MPDPTTPNLGLFIPARGADPGTWDVPANTNFSTLDAALGQTTTVAVTNVNITLSPAQYGCGTIVFTGNQTADVTITFPALGRIYNVFNNCTNNNTWLLRLGVAAGVVCAPPGELTSVYTDGVNFFYLGMGMVGTYWDYAGAVVPRWVSSSTVPPFLNCDGAAFSAVTYPSLNAVLGVANVPDLRGRFRAAMNQGTGRITAINGDVIFSAGGSQTIAQVNLPNYALPVTDPTHSHGISDPGHVHGVWQPDPAASTSGTDVAGFGPNFLNTNTAFTNITVAAAGTGISVNSGGSGTAIVPPSIITGITMIRAG